MRLAFVSILIAAAVGCGGATPKAAAPEPSAGPDLSPALAPVGWLRGDWEHEAGREHWVATAGVFYGVGFGADGGFEVMIVDDADEAATGGPDGTLRLYAMPGGAATETLFTRVATDGNEARFENPAHDDPTAIVYAPADRGLSAVVIGPQGEAIISMSQLDAETAPEAEAADVAFAADTDRDRVAGWVSYFADDGAMMRKGARVEGRDAIGALMAPLLGRGDLIWAPVWSRLSPDGRLAATVGRARLVEHAAVTWRGSYVTIWRATAEGWKVVFDTGRSENPL